MNPEFLPARFKLALAQLRLGQHDRAAATRAAHRRRTAGRLSRVAANLAAIAYSQQGSRSRRADWSARRWRSSRTTREAWNTLGAIYIVRKQPQAAVEALTTATRLNPANGQACLPQSVDGARRGRPGRLRACGRGHSLLDRPAIAAVVERPDETFVNRITRSALHHGGHRGHRMFVRWFEPLILRVLRVLCGGEVLAFIAPGAMLLSVSLAAQGAAPPIGRCARASEMARARALRSSAAASTTSPSSNGISERHLCRDGVRRRVADDRRRPHLEAGLRARRPMSIGAIAVSQSGSVGRGPAPASRTTATHRRGARASTSRPTAATRGRTIGLADTHHIGQIEIDPRNTNVVYVRRARPAVGRERGARPLQDDRRRQDVVARSFVNQDTGVVDVKLDPASPDTVLCGRLSAPAYGIRLQRRRRRQRALLSRPTAARRGRSSPTICRTRPAATRDGIGIAIYRKDPRIVHLEVEHSKRQRNVPERRPRRDVDRR